MGITDTDRPEDREPYEPDETNGIEETEEQYERDELDLEDEDDTRLPWLEGDDEDYEEGGSGQLIAFVLGGLLLLGAIVGALWWFTRGNAEDEMVADGSTIEAPDTPYKERPADPGGKEFEGTGDSSYAVSEGQERPAQLGTPGASDKAAEGPGFASVEKGAGKPGDATAGAGAGTDNTAPKPAATASAAPAASSGSGVGVQVGAYSSRAKAEADWNRMSGRVSALSGLSHRIVEGQADIGKVYRLQAVASDAAAANALCNKLKAAGQNCFVKD
ncbi:MAG: SPOR domain-containing protein [Sphingomonadaceae bacterium]|jgi:cell division septation protein DedD